MHMHCVAQHAAVLRSVTVYRHGVLLSVEQLVPWPAAQALLELPFQSSQGGGHSPQLHDLPPGAGM
jgi:hypothetical protein